MFLNRKAFLLGVEPERIRKQSSHGCLQILAFLDSMGLVLHDLGTKCSLVIILNTKKVTTQQYNTNYTRTLREASTNSLLSKVTTRDLLNFRSEIS